LYARYYLYTQTNGRYAPDRKQVYRQDASTQNSLTALILAMKSYYILVVHELLDTYYVTMESFMNSQYEA
jgi:hypothetical protein